MAMRTGLTAAAIAVLCVAGEPRVDNVTLPLRTAGRYIVDSAGYRVKLACTNWYGSQLKSFVQNGLDKQTPDYIAAQIGHMGFNCVRLPYSIQAYVQNPVIRPAYISALTNSANRTFLDVFDEVVSALTARGIMVIVNCHIGNAMWCCSGDDGNGLWSNANFSENAWIGSLRGLAARYRKNPLVVGYDLYNEVRQDMLGERLPAWGDVPTKALQGFRFADWQSASERAGRAVLEANPDALIVVEVLGYALFLCPFQMRQYPLRGLEGRLVWSSHEYSWNDKILTFFAEECRSRFSTSDFYVAFMRQSHDHNDVVDYSSYARIRDYIWGYIAKTGIGPLWVGEFGTGNRNSWWNWTIAYLKERDLDFAYWAVDGVKFPAAAPAFGEADNPNSYDESYGLLNQDYATVRHEWKLRDIQALCPSTSTPASHTIPAMPYFTTDTLFAATETPRPAANAIAKFMRKHASDGAGAEASTQMTKEPYVSALGWQWLLVVFLCLSIVAGVLARTCGLSFARARKRTTDATSTMHGPPMAFGTQRYRSSENWA